VGEQQVAVPQNTIDIPTLKNTIRAQARRTCGVSHTVEAQPAHPRVERAPDLQSQRSKINETRGKIAHSQAHRTRHAFTSQLTP
jgi:hypothetical protein